MSLEGEPYSVGEVVRALARPEVVRAGWRVSAAPRMSGTAAVIPLVFQGVPGRLEVYPSFSAAVGRAKGNAVQTGNVVVRFPRRAASEGLGVLLRAVQAVG